MAYPAPPSSAPYPPEEEGIRKLMPEHHNTGSSIEGALPVAPTLGPPLDAAHVPMERPVDARVAWLSALAILIAIVAGCIAQVLGRVIGLITNISFYGRFSSDFVSPADNHLGWIAVLVPVVGGLVVGLMARYGSKAIRGHGIPEAMEQVLTNKSRIPKRLLFFLL